MSIRFIMVVFCMSAVLQMSVAMADIKIGILARRGPEVVKQRWSALSDHLSRETGEQVQFVPVKFTELMDWCYNNRDQFLFAHPWFYIRAKIVHKAEALVTVQNKGAGLMFGGVIFSKKGSGIEKIEDIRGKALMCVKFSAAGGWILQKGVLVKNGVRPEKDCKLLLEGKTHDAVAVAVQNGEVDVGTVRSSIFSRLNREGKISIDDFIIIHPVEHEGFPYPCSTPLYPNWPLASLKNTPPGQAEKLKKALLSIPRGAPALEPCKVDHFVDALDYGPFEDLLRFLKVKPFRR
jgi:ABC-type phosphate/phosphonate transport system substrate-binding protein